LIQETKSQHEIEKQMSKINIEDAYEDIDVLKEYKIKQLESIL